MEVDQFDSLSDPVSLYNELDEDMFPNMKTLIHEGCVLPITSCEAERSFSGLRKIKNDMRNTMHEERLTGLALMHLHHSMDIELDDIVQRFIKTNNRRPFQSSVVLSSECAE